MQFRQFNIFPFAAPSTPSSWRQKPLISIVLPVYNHGNFVAQSIASVLQPLQHPLELIIVDDGSTDDTPEVLSRLPHDPRLRIIRQENRGLAQALNRGFSLARGAYIGWTSADNRYLPGALDRLADFLGSNPSVGLVYANVVLVDENGAPLRESWYRKEDQHPQESSLLCLPLSADTLWERSDNFINAAVLFRGELKRLVGPHHPSFLGFEDYDYWLRIALHQKLAHLDDDAPQYEYRLHKASLTAVLDSGELSSAQKSVVLGARYAQRLLGKPLMFPLEGGNRDSAPWAACIEGALEAAGYRPQRKKGILPAGGGASFVVLPPRIERCMDSNEQDALERIKERHLCLAPQKQSELLHATFARYLDTQSACLLEMSPPEAICGGSLTPRSLLPPPLNLPSMLRRARDTSFGAVTPANGSLRTVLVFSPDEPQVLDAEEYDRRFVLLRELLGVFPQFTFVLYCENHAQRRTADRLNLSLADNSNLRIIDVSAAAAGNHSTEVLSEPLLYVLSSVDLVCALKYSFPTLSNLLELRVEAALAALAGRPIVLITSNSAVTAFSGPSTAGQCSEDLEALSASCLALPHLAHFGLEIDASLSTLEPGKMAWLTKIFHEAGNGVSQGSLEQYLGTLTPAALGRKLAAAFFSAQTG